MVVWNAMFWFHSWHVDFSVEAFALLDINSEPQRFGDTETHTANTFYLFFISISLERFGFQVLIMLYESSRRKPG